MKSQPEVNMQTEIASTILLFQYTFHDATYLYRPVTSGVRGIRGLQSCTVLASMKLHWSPSLVFNENIHTATGIGRRIIFFVRNHRIQCPYTCIQ